MTAKAATKEQQRRFGAMWQLGCIACYLDEHEAFQCGETEIHHMLKGSRRIGHDATVPLGSWHHQGVANGISNKFMLSELGPSYHKHRRAFRERYGSDAELVEKVNALLVERGLYP